MIMNIMFSRILINIICPFRWWQIQELCNASVDAFVDGKIQEFYLCLVDFDKYNLPLPLVANTGIMQCFC